MKLLITAPCLLSPFYVYRGPKEKEFKTAEGLRELLAELGDEWQVLAYPCPEYELIGWPRPPMSREVYMHLGMVEKAKTIADFIGRILTEEKPEKVIFLGVKGSPTCGVFHTTKSNPDDFDFKAMQEFFYMSKGGRLERSKEVMEKAGFKLVPGEGILFEVLKDRFPEAVYLEFDKDDIERSVERVKEALRN